jgi:hypothetical protein
MGHRCRRGIRRRASRRRTFFIHTGHHKITFGGEFAFATHDFDAHVLEYGLFQFQTDAPFDEDVPRTWPFAFQQLKPTVFRASTISMRGCWTQPRWLGWILSSAAIAEQTPTTSNLAWG